MARVTFWSMVPGHDEPVRIVLTKDRVVTFEKHGRHDEGWFAVSETYYLSRSAFGRVVVCESTDDGTDCDGRMSHGATHYAKVNELRACRSWCWSIDGKVRTRERYRFPRWRKTEAYQRDYAAERAGY